MVHAFSSNKITPISTNQKLMYLIQIQFFLISWKACECFTPFRIGNSSDRITAHFNFKTLEILLLIS
jgi:hypothetical protein